MSDSDMLIVDGKFVRLFGVDGPEKLQQCFVGEQSWDCHASAVRHLETLVADGQADCEIRGEPDPYGRVAAVCLVGGKDVAEAMVRAGWALVVRNQAPEYIPSEEAAQADQAGMWLGEFVPPWELRNTRRND